MDEATLREHLAHFAERARLTALGVAVHDFESGRTFAVEGERPFHAASTFKAAVLLALLKEVAAGRAGWEAHLHVRNRFLSAADGTPYRIESNRDGDEQVHREVGRSLPLGTLASRMIVRSSNLATNLLLDFLSVARVRAILAEAGVEGLEVRRGVEDLVAYEQGLNNEATALGLVKLFAAFWREDFLPGPWRREGLEILHAQEFRAMLPARLPKGVRVAHKTGEISTHGHDAGLVFPVGRAPYAIAILTEHEPGLQGRDRVVAEISRAVYDWLLAPAAPAIPVS